MSRPGTTSIKKTKKNQGPRTNGSTQRESAPLALMPSPGAGLNTIGIRPPSASPMPSSSPAALTSRTQWAHHHPVHLARHPSLPSSHIDTLLVPFAWYIWLIKLPFVDGFRMSDVVLNTSMLLLPFFGRAVTQSRPATIIGRKTCGKIAGSQEAAQQCGPAAAKRQGGVL